MISRPLRDSEKRVLRRLRQGPLPMDDWRTMTPGANFSKALQVHVCYLRQAGCTIDLVSGSYTLNSEPPGLLDDTIEFMSGGSFPIGLHFKREYNGVQIYLRDCDQFTDSRILKSAEVERLIAFLQDSLL